MNRERITPATMALLWRLAGIILLAALWVVEAGGEAGLVLVLFLCILALARWRVAVPPWAVVVDQAACIGALAFWPASAFALALPLFDACVAARPIWALPSLVAIFLFGLWSLPLAAVASLAVLSGWALHLWASQLQGARQEADRDRRERFELESLKGELLSANVRVARMAKLAERNRIARDLHDHAGHEMTAAQLALQAFHRLWDEGDPQAAGMLDQVEGRVAAGMELLRSTVRGMAPQAAAGIGALEEVCRRFTACEVALSVHGDTEAVPVHAWGVLEPCLKEALSNASRHGAARRVDVSLDVGPHIVRLSVHNPARDALSASSGVGLGLRNLGQRARAVGGSISVDAREGFRLICVLPLGDDPRVTVVDEAVSS